ncbi:MAG: hypothetical protein JWN07_1012 [Hyphomicrobiales bacterium]|nr:hypothetical protein [Hyphomicrobiales bacterium]
MNDKSDNPLSRVLARWGLTPEATGSADAIEPGEEQEILRCLGAAVIARWADLPREIQRSLYDAAVAVGRPGREDIAVFLHDHHRDTAGR